MFRINKKPTSGAQYKQTKLMNIAMFRLFAFFCFPMRKKCIFCMSVCVAKKGYRHTQAPTNTCWTIIYPQINNHLDLNCMSRFNWEFLGLCEFIFILTSLAYHWISIEQTTFGYNFLNYVWRTTKFLLCFRKKTQFTPKGKSILWRHWMRNSSIF